jgi:hypothetical protein
MARRSGKKYAKKRADSLGQAKDSTAMPSQGKKKSGPIPTASPPQQISAKKRKMSAPTLGSPPSKSTQKKIKVDRSMSEPSLAKTTPPNATELSCIPVAPKLNKRFYEALVMLEILGRNRGEHIGEEDDVELGPSLSSLKSDCLQRRSFLRHLAYLCDYENGGDRTTAIALQHTPQHVIFWFATNSSSHRTIDFLKSILQSLQCIGPNDVDRVESQIFKAAVEFSDKRIKHYVDLIKNDVVFILKELAESTSEESMVPSGNPRLHSDWF